MTASRDRAARFLFERGGLIGLVALVAYGVLASPFIVDGDNAEFATLAHTGGLAHPSGYPLYVLWLRAWSWLPGSPAHAAALATALLGAATVVVLVAACRAWGARPGSATLAVAIVCGSPIVLRMHSEAEVFAMNDLACALVLWLAAQQGPVRGAWRAVLLGLVAGLGLSDHLTCALLAPVGILGVVRAVHESRRALPVVVMGLGSLVLGLSPYIYAFTAPDTPMSWGGPHDLGGLVGLVTRRDYGGVAAFSPDGESVSTWSQLAALGGTLGRAWLYVPALAGLATLARRVTSSTPSAHDAEPPDTADAHGPDVHPRETRWAWAMLGLAWLLAGPLLVSRFDVPTEGVGLSVCERFHVLPALLLAIPVAVAIDGLSPHGPRVGRVLAAALALPASIALSLPYLGRVHTAAVERYAQNVLEALPDSVVLVVAEDYVYAGTQYAQAALGTRPDVTVVDTGLLTFPWYRARLARRGLAMPPDAPTGGWVVEHALADGKRVFVDLKQKDVLAAFPTFPYGAMIAVRPRGTPVPPVADIAELNHGLYGAFRLDYTPPGTDDEYATVIHRHYAAIWEIIARSLDAAHATDEAKAARETEAELAPRLTPEQPTGPRRKVDVQE